MTHIWPIGGGKGGSGKSFLTSNLGISLARQNKKTLLIDVDLGAANLHTLIGLHQPEKCLSDFINKKVKTLEETVIKTSIPNLFLISGARNNLDIANLAYAQKMKVLRAISRLPYEYILLDIGAGTSFNTIDFFLLSNSGIFVTTSEPTSIENIYRLIRAVYLRKIRQALNPKDFRALVNEASTRQSDTNIDYLKNLVHIVKENEPEKGRILEQTLQALRFKLVLNQLRKQDNPNLGSLMCKVIERHLGIKMQFLGNISFDDHVHDAVCKKSVFIYKYPYTQAALDLRGFCDNILLTGNQGLKDSDVALGR